MSGTTEKKGIKLPLLHMQRKGKNLNYSFVPITRIIIYLCILFRTQFWFFYYYSRSRADCFDEKERKHWLGMLPFYSYNFLKRNLHTGFFHNEF